METSLKFCISLGVCFKSINAICLIPILYICILKKVYANCDDIRESISHDIQIHVIMKRFFFNLDFLMLIITSTYRATLPLIIFVYDWKSMQGRVA